MRKRIGPRSLYLRRDLLNGRDLFDWALSQGVTQLKRPTGLHVTIAYSRAVIHWASARAVGPGAASLTVAGGERAVGLYDNGALVLQFEAQTLLDRHMQLYELGASWDDPEYRPHVTVGFAHGVVNVASVEPYEGPLVFGPEIFAEPSR